MSDLEKIWINYLNSFGIKRKQELHSKLIQWTTENNKSIENKSIESILSEYNLWYMLYL